jgi:arsenate reductase (glutaredoxin)
MSITLHGIPNCDTVKKARTWLDTAGVAHDFRDYKKVPPTVAELTGWADTLGWEALLNRAGTTFRKLSDAEKADLDATKAIALMMANPSLIKRPLVTGAPQMLIGFKPEAWAAAFA